MGTGRIGRAASRQRNRDKHLAQGLCQFCCNKLSERSKWSCDKHLEMNRVRAKKKRDEKKLKK